jgi:hypothetical protein
MSARPAPGRPCAVARLAGPVALLLLAACAGRAASAPTRRGAPAEAVTPEFQAMRVALSRAEGAARANDARTVRAGAGDVTDRGIALLRARVPHDLQRADLPRFLEGRAAFGDALRAFAAATESPDDARVLRALQDLVDTYWGWVDAYHGLAPERSV